MAFGDHKHHCDIQLFASWREKMTHRNGQLFLVTQTPRAYSWRLEAPLRNTRHAVETITAYITVGDEVLCSKSPNWAKRRYDFNSNRSDSDLLERVRFSSGCSIVACRNWFECKSHYPSTWQPVLKNLSPHSPNYAFVAETWTQQALCSCDNYYAKSKLAVLWSIFMRY